MFLPEYAQHDLEARLSGLRRSPQERETVAALEAALRSIEEGRWGICRDCGTPIAPSRLCSNPETDRCASCSARTSALEHR